jgi:hypothetical protein
MRTLTAPEVPPQAGRQPEGHTPEVPPQAGRQPEGHTLRSLVRIAVLGASLAAVLGAGPARAEDSTPPVRQAGKHFQRGVALYGEADYRGALVEFRRAYSLAPNPAVLYNVGETQYQLQDYAGALTSFEHFLAESTPGDGHRGEVEADLEVLRARVGHVSVSTLPGGAEITVDDQPMGKTPLERSLLVSIGHRKIVASIAGRPAATRWIDVAADDNVTVTIPLADSAEPASSALARTELPLHAADLPQTPHASNTLRILGWTATGALAAGAVTFGVLAFTESNALRTARDTFPTSSAALSHDATMTTTYSTVADLLAAGAIVVGGVTLATTLFASSPSESPRRGGAGSTRVVLGPGAAYLDGTF